MKQRQARTLGVIENVFREFFREEGFDRSENFRGNYMFFRVPYGDLRHLSNRIGAFIERDEEVGVIGFEEQTSLMEIREFIEYTDRKNARVVIFYLDQFDDGINLERFFVYRASTQDEKTDIALFITNRERNVISELNEREDLIQGFGNYNVKYLDFRDGSFVKLEREHY